MSFDIPQGSNFPVVGNPVQSPPIYSRDGDRAEFNFPRADNGNGKNVIYGREDLEKTEPIKPKGACQTCEGRRYVDQSDDSSVSYQTPTKLNSQTAAAAVAAHEREHVFNERANASREGRRITMQTVSVHYAICPECGIMYPSGGTTRTQSIKSDNDKTNELLKTAAATKPQGQAS